MIDIAQIDFSKSDGLVPCIVQDANTKNVLMLGYMNADAILKTLETKKVTFYSRSKERLWMKGETSGNILNLIDMKLDCDRDTLLVKVNPAGPVCHTGADTCFDESNKELDLQNLESIIEYRKQNPKKGSYTSDLFSKNINKIAQKVGEEAVELVIEAKDQNEELFLGEAADLLFHYLVLLQAKDHSLKDVLSVLKKRHKPD
jgi:phosphoribosyl-ATP pyrophosphohydrolase/phosphoribosyl-AMP cyclohydrolase